MFSIFYSRRANVSISAEIHKTPRGLLLAARPSVEQIGPFRLKFRKEKGAELAVTEILIFESGKAETGREIPAKAFPGNELFVSQGETLNSSVLFPLSAPQSSELAGWSVSLNVAGGGSLRHGVRWADRVFVAAPEYDSSETGGNDLDRGNEGAQTQ